MCTSKVFSWRNGGRGELSVSFWNFIRFIKIWIASLHFTTGLEESCDLTCLSWRFRIWKILLFYRENIKLKLKIPDNKTLKDASHRALFNGIFTMCFYHVFFDVTILRLGPFFPPKNSLPCWLISSSRHTDKFLGRIIAISPCWPSLWTVDLLHVHLWIFKLHRVKQCTMCQCTNYYDNTNSSGCLQWLEQL